MARWIKVAAIMAVAGCAWTYPGQYGAGTAGYYWQQAGRDCNSLEAQRLIDIEEEKLQIMRERNRLLRALGTAVR